MTQLVAPVKSPYGRHIPVETSLRRAILQDRCCRVELLDRLIDQCNDRKNPNAMSELSIVFLQFPTRVLVRIESKGKSRKDWEAPLKTLAMENAPSLFHTIELTLLLNIPNNFPSLGDGVAQEVTSRLFSSDIKLRLMTTRTLVNIYAFTLNSSNPPTFVYQLNQAVKQYMTANDFKINRDTYRPFSLDVSSAPNVYLEYVLSPYIFNPGEYK